MDPHLNGWNPSNGQQASGVRRFLPVFGTLRTAGIAGGVAIVGLAVLHVTLPLGYRPGDIIGDFYGSIVAAEQNRARPATVATAQQTADAQAQAQARGQQQTLALQTAQQYGMIQALPFMMDQMFTGFGCGMGRMSGDARLQQGCSGASPGGIGQQAGTVMDQLGTTRAWTGQAPPQSAAPVPAATAPAANDGPPLKQGEFDRIARLENALTAQAATGCKAKHPGSSNNEWRAYASCLRVASGEAGVGAEYDDRPRVVSVP